MGWRVRKRELNIGIAPEQIAVELRGSLETIRYRWHHTDETGRPVNSGVAAHDKREYLTLLQQYDQHRDPRPLAAFIEIRPLSE